MRDSQAAYLVPVRGGQGTLPDVESCWDAATAAVAVATRAPPPGAAAPLRPGSLTGFPSRPLTGRGCILRGVVFGVGQNCTLP